MRPRAYAQSNIEAFENANVRLQTIICDGNRKCQCMLKNMNTVNVHQFKFSQLVTHRENPRARFDREEEMFLARFSMIKLILEKNRRLKNYMLIQVNRKSLYQFLLEGVFRDINICSRGLR